MNIGDRIKMTDEEQAQIAALEKKHGDEESAMHKRHSEEFSAPWQTIRKAHPETEGCLLLWRGDSFFVLRVPAEKPI